MTDSTDLQPHVDIRVCKIIEGSVLYRLGYLSEVFANGCCIAFKKPPCDLIREWWSEGSWPTQEETNSVLTAEEMKDIVNG